MMSAGRRGSRWISRMSALTGARPSTVTSTMVLAALMPTSMLLRARSVDDERFGVPAVTVDDGGNLARAAEGASGALARLGARGGLEIHLLCHVPILT